MALAIITLFLFFSAMIMDIVVSTNIMALVGVSSLIWFMYWLKIVVYIIAFILAEIAKKQ